MALDPPDTAANIWRNYNIDGVPSSGAYEPEKEKIREWGTWVESTKVGSEQVSAIVRLTQAAYNALNPKDPNTLYIIVN